VHDGSVLALLLDADGVMQQNPPGWLDDVTRYVAAADRDAFAEDLFASEEEAMRGRRPFRELLVEVCRRWDVGHRAGELVEHWKRVEVSTEMVALVRRLRRAGLSCHLATNQNDERAAHLRDTVGYAELFDTTYFSCDLGLLKSDPPFFERVLADLGVRPAEVLFVDDSPGHVETARSAGLRAETWCLRDGVAALRPLLAPHGVRVEPTP
jgi:putative hydrolase of the HAD superfamily